mmetsp:Transcript_35211/g.54052  ORF Transcript_35211/g.54052 Transcript_35211/m.54052 type:complete len:221 (+) Transcript_35211:701-1363(+)
MVVVVVVVFFPTTIPSTTCECGKCITRITRGVATGTSKGHVTWFQPVQWTLHEGIVLFEMQQQGSPESILAQDTWIAQQNQTEAGPGQGHVETTRVGQKANSLCFAGTNARNKDKVLFAALKGIDGCNFDCFVQRRGETTRAAHVIRNVFLLSVIWRNDTNLGWGDTHAQQVSHNLLHVRCLCSIEIGSTRRRDFFHTSNRVKEHWFVWHRPREIFLSFE